MDVLTRLPAVVLLERLPVPSLAMARDGIILFANTAFAEMVGHPQDGLAGPAFPATFHTVPRRRPQSHSVETSDVETSDRISEPA
jgi:PAS domain S-box-containing protein